MIRLTPEALRKEYDRGCVVAVEGLSPNIEGGEFITVVGPSGYGKSTTPRMVAGLESPSNGTTRIGSEGVTDQHTRKRDVVVVLQNYTLCPYKAVMQSTAFGLRTSIGLSKDERRERIHETTVVMSIEDLLGNKPDELSGGQKQWAALGHTIVREPGVFLFDKPLLNLDAKLRTAVRTEIQRLQNELGITSLYAAYDREEAMTMSDKVITLNDRELQQVDRSKDTYGNPANESVGGFVDSPPMNLLNASVEREGDHPAFAGNSPLLYRLSESFSTTPREATDAASLRVGVRPEDMVTASSGENVVSPTVGVVGPIGSDNYLHPDIGPDFTTYADSDVEPEADEAVGVTFDEPDLHVFRSRIDESLLSHGLRWRAAPVQQA